jgi:uncharacterized protein (TIGR03086 family)
MIGPFDAHERTVDSTVSIVANIVPAQFGAPTPCADFDVQALLEHLIAANLRFVALASGEAADGRAPAREHIRDGDVARPYRASARAVTAAWRDPSLLDGRYRLPIGDVPGTVAIGIHTVEALVHGWDLAKATGQPTEIAPDLFAFAWEHCRGIDDSLRGPGRPFGPPVEAPNGATDTERLMAWLGRTTSDTPTT